MTEQPSLIPLVKTSPCYLDGDGQPHDETFGCEVCERPVCGVCADPGNGSEWFCPDCDPLAQEESQDG